MKKDLRNVILIVIFVLILGLGINVYAASYDCYDVIDKDLLEALNNYVYKPIKWLTPTLLILLTSFDFAKVVFGGKKEEMDKAKNNFMKRAVAALIIFFAPNVIILIVDLVQQSSIRSCLDKLP